MLNWHVKWGLKIGLAIPVMYLHLLYQSVCSKQIEDWEWECIRHNDDVAEAKLLQKYGGMRWNDPDGDEGASRGMCIADAGNMEFQGGRNGAGWCLIGTNELDGGMEPWTIDVVIDLIAEYPQPAESNVEVVMDAELREANVERARQQSNKKQQTIQRKKNKKNKKEYLLSRSSWTKRVWGPWPIRCTF